jgi:hypothetical protein
LKRTFFRLVRRLAGILLILWLLRLGFNASKDFVTGTVDEISFVTAKSEMRSFHMVLMSFYTSYERYPEPEFELWKWFDEHFETTHDKYNRDPWLNPYWFLAQDWEILCTGPDAVMGSRDDLIQRYPRGVTP